MALVMAYHIAFLPHGVIGAPNNTLPAGTVKDTVLVTDHVLADDTPIYAHGSEPEIAVTESGGKAQPQIVYWPVMQDVIEGRNAGLRAEESAPVVSRETVRCRGGKYGGRTFSARVDGELLTVREHLGPGDAFTYRRTSESDRGTVVFEYEAAEAAP